GDGPAAGRVHHLLLLAGCARPLALLPWAGGPLRRVGDGTRPLLRGQLRPLRLRAGPGAALLPGGLLRWPRAGLALGARTRPSLPPLAAGPGLLPLRSHRDLVARSGILVAPGATLLLGGAADPRLFDPGHAGRALPLRHRPAGSRAAERHVARVGRGAGAPAPGGGARLAYAGGGLVPAAPGRAGFPAALSPSKVRPLAARPAPERSAVMAAYPNAPRGCASAR